MRLLLALLLSAFLLTCCRGEVRKVRRVKKMQVWATAYCQIPKRTAFPRHERPGTCATDWKVIPQYSTVYVGGKKLIARGRHGKRGKVIDIYLPSRGECVKFGRRKVWARIER